MPTVPRANLPGNTSPLAGQRFNPSTPESAFTPSQPIDVSPVAKLSQSIWETQKAKADQVAVMEADAKSSHFETDLLYNPDTGLMNRKGKNALGIPEEAMGAWQKHASEVEAGLANDSQKLAYRKMALQRETDMDTAVQRHVSDQLQAYDTETTKSYIEGEQRSSLINFEDPDRVEQSIRRQQDAYKLYAQRNGMPKEWLDEQLAQVSSKTHAGVINRILARGNDLQASKYYEDHKSEITGPEAVATEKALEEGSTRGESQRQADKIVTGAVNRSQALLQAKEIKDSKVRDATEDRINHFYDEQNEIKRETQDQLYLTATNILDANRRGVQPRMVVPPGIWAKLSLEQRRALENRSKNADELYNNDKLWLAFLDLHPNDLGKMTEGEFETKYWSEFDGPHRERAAAQWAAARDAVTNGKYKSPQLAATLTFKDRVNNTLKSSGMIPANRAAAKMTKGERQLYIEFEDEAARQVEEFEMNELLGKRKATGNEIQVILDNMAKTRVFLDKNWVRSDPQKVAALVTQDEKGLAYVPYDQVPTADKNSIENQLRSRGKRITRDAVQRAYAAVLLNDHALFDSIVSGSTSISTPGTAAPPAKKDTTTIDAPISGVQ